MSRLFAGVQKYLQVNGFLSDPLRACSPLFVWVGVLLVYMSLSKVSRLSHSNTIPNRLKDIVDEVLRSGRVVEVVTSLPSGLSL
jgi:hypothetical protein